MDTLSFASKIPLRCYFKIFLFNREPLFNMYCLSKLFKNCISCIDLDWSLLYQQADFYVMLKQYVCEYINGGGVRNVSEAVKRPVVCLYSLLWSQVGSSFPLLKLARSWVCAERGWNKCGICLGKFTQAYMRGGESMYTQFLFFDVFWRINGLIEDNSKKFCSPFWLCHLPSLIKEHQLPLPLLHNEEVWARQGCWESQCRVGFCFPRSLQ